MASAGVIANLHEPRRVVAAAAGRRNVHQREPAVWTTGNPVTRRRFADSNMR